MPLTITIRQSMQFRTGCGAKRATLNGNADMRLSGGFGVSYSSERLGLEAPPSFSCIHQLTQSITGASLGINAILVDYGVRSSVLTPQEAGDRVGKGHGQLSQASDGGGRLPCCRDRRP